MTARRLKMQKKDKKLLAELMGAIGFIIILIPIFTGLYAFTYGLLAAIIIWILSGIVAKYWGVKK
jgi:hypothetical protein